FNTQLASPEGVRRQVVEVEVAGTNGDRYRDEMVRLIRDRAPAARVVVTAPAADGLTERQSAKRRDAADGRVVVTIRSSSVVEPVPEVRPVPDVPVRPDLSLSTRPEGAQPVSQAGQQDLTEWRNPSDGNQGEPVAPQSWLNASQVSADLVVVRDVGERTWLVLMPSDGNLDSHQVPAELRDELNEFLVEASRRDEDGTRARFVVEASGFHSGSERAKDVMGWLLGIDPSPVRARTSQRVVATLLPRVPDLVIRAKTQSGDAGNRFGSIGLGRAARTEVASRVVRFTMRREAVPMATAILQPDSDERNHDAEAGTRPAGSGQSSADPIDVDMVPDPLPPLEPELPSSNENRDDVPSDDDMYIGDDMVVDRPIVPEPRPAQAPPVLDADDPMGFGLIEQDRPTDVEIADAGPLDVLGALDPLVHNADMVLINSAIDLLDRAGAVDAILGNLAGGVVSPEELIWRSALLVSSDLVADEPAAERSARSVARWARSGDIASLTAAFLPEPGQDAEVPAAEVPRADVPAGQGIRDVGAQIVAGSGLAVVLAGFDGDTSEVERFVLASARVAAAQVGEAGARQWVGALTDAARLVADAGLWTLLRDRPAGPQAFFELVALVANDVYWHGGNMAMATAGGVASAVGMLDDRHVTEYLLRELSPERVGQSRWRDLVNEMQLKLPRNVDHAETLADNEARRRGGTETSDHLMWVAERLESGMDSGNVVWFTAADVELMPLRGPGGAVAGSMLLSRNDGDAAGFVGERFNAVTFTHAADLPAEGADERFEEQHAAIDRGEYTASWSPWARNEDGVYFVVARGTRGTAQLQLRDGRLVDVSGEVLGRLVMSSGSLPADGRFGSVALVVTDSALPGPDGRSVATGFTGAANAVGVPVRVHALAGTGNAFVHSSAIGDENPVDIGVVALDRGSSWVTLGPNGAPQQQPDGAERALDRLLPDDVAGFVQNGLRSHVQRLHESEGAQRATEFARTIEPVAGQLDALGLFDLVALRELPAQVRASVVADVVEVVTWESMTNEAESALRLASRLTTALRLVAGTGVLDQLLAESVRSQEATDFLWQTLLGLVRAVATETDEGDTSADVDADAEVLAIVVRSGVVTSMITAGDFAGLRQTMEALREVYDEHGRETAMVVLERQFSRDQLVDAEQWLLEADSQPVMPVPNPTPEQLRRQEEREEHRRQMAQAVAEFEAGVRTWESLNALVAELAGRSGPWTSAPLGAAPTRRTGRQSRGSAVGSTGPEAGSSRRSGGSAQTGQGAARPQARLGGLNLGVFHGERFTIPLPQRSTGVSDAAGSRQIADLADQVVSGLPARLPTAASPRASVLVTGSTLERAEIVRDQLVADLVDAHRDRYGAVGDGAQAHLESLVVAGVDAGLIDEVQIRPVPASFEPSGTGGTVAFSSADQLADFVAAPDIAFDALIENLNTQLAPSGGVRRHVVEVEVAGAGGDRYRDAVVRLITARAPAARVVASAPAADGMTARQRSKQRDTTDGQTVVTIRTTAVVEPVREMPPPVPRADTGDRADVPSGSTIVRTERQHGWLLLSPDRAHAGSVDRGSEAGFREFLDHVVALPAATDDGRAITWAMHLTTYGDDVATRTERTTGLLEFVAVDVLGGVELPQHLEFVRHQDTAITLTELLSDERMATEVVDLLSPRLVRIVIVGHTGDQQVALPRLPAAPARPDWLRSTRPEGSQLAVRTDQPDPVAWSVPSDVPRDLHVRRNPATGAWLVLVPRDVPLAGLEVPGALRAEIDAFVTAARDHAEPGQVSQWTVAATGFGDGTSRARTVLAWLLGVDPSVLPTRSARGRGAPQSRLSHLDISLSSRGVGEVGNVGSTRVGDGARVEVADRLVRVTTTRPAVAPSEVGDSLAQESAPVISELFLPETWTARSDVPAGLEVVEGSRTAESWRTESSWRVLLPRGGRLDGLEVPAALREAVATYLDAAASPGQDEGGRSERWRVTATGFVRGSDHARAVMAWLMGVDPKNLTTNPRRELVEKKMPHLPPQLNLRLTSVKPNTMGRTLGSVNLEGAAFDEVASRVVRFTMVGVPVPQRGPDERVDDGVENLVSPELRTNDEVVVDPPRPVATVLPNEPGSWDTAADVPAGPLVAPGSDPGTWRVLMPSDGQLDRHGVPEVLAAELGRFLAAARQTGEGGAQPWRIWASDFDGRAVRARAVMGWLLGVDPNVINQPRVPQSVMQTELPDVPSHLDLRTDSRRGRSAGNSFGPVVIGDGARGEALSRMVPVTLSGPPGWQRGVVVEQPGTAGTQDVADDRENADLDPANDGPTPDTDPIPDAPARWAIASDVPAGLLVRPGASRGTWLVLVPRDGDLRGRRAPAALRGALGDFLAEAARPASERTGPGASDLFRVATTGYSGGTQRARAVMGWLLGAGPTAFAEVTSRQVPTALVPRLPGDLVVEASTASAKNMGESFGPTRFEPDARTEVASRLVRFTMSRVAVADENADVVTRPPGVPEPMRLDDVPTDDDMHVDDPTDVGFVWGSETGEAQDFMATEAALTVMTSAYGVLEDVEALEAIRLGLAGTDADVEVVIWQSVLLVSRFIALNDHETAVQWGQFVAATARIGDLATLTDVLSVDPVQRAETPAADDIPPVVDAPDLAAVIVAASGLAVVLTDLDGDTSEIERFVLASARLALAEGGEAAARQWVGALTDAVRFTSDVGLWTSLRDRHAGPQAFIELMTLVANNAYWRGENAAMVTAHGVAVAVKMLDARSVTERLLIELDPQRVGQSRLRDLVDEMRTHTLRDAEALADNEARRLDTTRTGSSGRLVAEPTLAHEMEAERLLVRAGSQLVMPVSDPSPERARRLVEREELRRQVAVAVMEVDLGVRSQESLDALVADLTRGSGPWTAPPMGAARFRPGDRQEGGSGGGSSRPEEAGPSTRPGGSAQVGLGAGRSQVPLGRGSGGVFGGQRFSIPLGRRDSDVLDAAGSRQIAMFGDDVVVG
ncbi:hypothetical protein SK854_47955, partial [Lentzea sp. BCCO 10_0061]